MLQILDDQPPYIRMILGAVIGSLILGFPALISTVWESWGESRGQPALSRASFMAAAIGKFLAAVAVFAVLILLSNCDGCDGGIDDYKFVEWR